MFFLGWICLINQRLSEFNLGLITKNHYTIVIQFNIFTRTPLKNNVLKSTPHTFKLAELVLCTKNLLRCAGKFLTQTTIINFSKNKKRSNFLKSPSPFASNKNKPQFFTVWNWLACTPMVLGAPDISNQRLLPLDSFHFNVFKDCCSYLLQSLTMHQQTCGLYFVDDQGWIAVFNIALQSTETKTPKVWCINLLSCAGKFLSRNGYWKTLIFFQYFQYRLTINYPPRFGKIGDLGGNSKRIKWRKYFLLLIISLKQCI